MQEETSSTFFTLSCRGFSATFRGTEPIIRDRAAAGCALQSSCAAAESASFQEIRPGSFLAEEPLTLVLMQRQGRHGWIKIAQLLSASLKILVHFKFICQENKKTDFFFEQGCSPSWLQKHLSARNRGVKGLMTETPFGSQGCSQILSKHNQVVLAQVVCPTGQQ